MAGGLGVRLMRLRTNDLPVCVVISVGPGNYLGADGWRRRLMGPIDYFMAILVGMCIGLAGEAVYFSLAF